MAHRRGLPRRYDRLHRPIVITITTALVAATFGVMYLVDEHRRTACEERARDGGHHLWADAGWWSGRSICVEVVAPRCEDTPTTSTRK